MNSYQPTFKQQLIIGIALCIWILLFAIFIKPFEHGTMTTQIWFFVSTSFGLSAFLSYMGIAFFQKKITNKFIVWDYRFEVLAIILFYILYSILTYTFYKSPLINGFYTFPEFLNQIILTSSIVLTPVLILIRQFASKLFPKREEEDIIIKGENKLDILKTKPAKIIFASNAHNYVEISYLDGAKINKKVIRSSLKNILNEHPFLVQIHRSYLINPSHIISWKDSNTIILTQTELPVSKKFKNNVPALK